MPKTILITGQSFSNLNSYLLEHGFEYVVLRDMHSAKHTGKKFKRRVLANFSNRDELFRTVDELAHKRPIDGIMNVYEHYVQPAAEIAKQLKLPGMPIQAAQACTDKYIMRECFSRSSYKISPDFAFVKNEDDVQAFASAHTFPIILKPANLSKSLLVFKNNSLEELLYNYGRMAETIGDVYAKYAPHTIPKIIIESFMEGPVHSVDAFVDAQGIPHVLEQVVDYQTGYEIGYDDNFHYSRLLPSSLSAEDIAAIRSTATRGCQVLGMKNTPAHIEIILTEAGPRIVEIGARNGGYRERMHGAANGIDIIGNALRLSLGEQPVTQATRNDAMGVFELFPKTPGKFIGIANEEPLRALASLNYLSIKATPGTFVGKSSEGFKMSAVVILHNTDHGQFARDHAFLDKYVHVLTA